MSSNVSVKSVYCTLHPQLGRWQTFGRGSGDHSLAGDSAQTSHARSMYARLSPPPTLTVHGWGCRQARWLDASLRRGHRAASRRLLRAKAARQGWCSGALRGVTDFTTWGAARFVRRRAERNGSRGDLETGRQPSVLPRTWYCIHYRASWTGSLIFGRCNSFVASP